MKAALGHTALVASIAIVEDTDPIAQLVADHLGDTGHRTTIYADGAQARKALTRTLPDVVVLDLMLPGCNGMEICRALRACQGKQPIIVMLTARAEEGDAMAGYEAGADDYVRKPFGVKELVARVQALLTLAARKPPTAESSRLVLGTLVVERQARTAQVGEVTLRLAPMELDLLAYCCTRPGAVLDRPQLLRDVWGYDHAGYARTVDSHIARLRKKLAAAQWDGSITTLHGVGYRFDGPT